MATIVYRNATLIVNGADISGSLHELAVEFAAEILDETHFGDDTRRKKGGLLIGKISGKGRFDGAVGIDAVLFAGTGGGAALAVNPGYENGAIVEDTLLVLFPDGVTEGSQTTGIGFAMKGVLTTFDVGGAVGALLDITFAAESRGVAA